MSQTRNARNEPGLTSLKHSDTGPDGELPLGPLIFGRAFTSIPSMPKRSSKPHPDENVSAFDAVARLTGGQPASIDPDEARHAAAALLGSLGGKKGGPARAKALSKKRRSEIATNAARARWKDKEA